MLFSDVSNPPQPDADPELSEVWHRIKTMDPKGDRFARVLRNTIDQLLDGENTGRYDWKQLFKTEKTHAGTLVEINLQREFKFDDGVDMDYAIGGVEVDCKYSQKFGGWMLPPECIGHICLLVTADDYTSSWSAGLLRIGHELLNPGKNRDLKLHLKSEHRSRIQWLWHAAQLPENVLLHLDDHDRQAIFSLKSGQARLNELFRRAQNRRISRNVVRTVAQQKDYMKRVRGNGGSRSALRNEGILVIGDYSRHQAIARDLGALVPGEGEFVSIQVSRVDDHHTHSHTASLDGCYWKIATPQDPTDQAPLLPRHTADQEE